MYNFVTIKTLPIDEKVTTLSFRPDHVASAMCTPEGDYYYLRVATLGGDVVSFNADPENAEKLCKNLGLEW